MEKKSFLKRVFKRNSHNNISKALAGFGRSLHRFYENRNHDVYSNGELTVLKKISKINPKVIFDGGANVGNYSLLINETNPNAKIYAFEPVKKTFSILKENTRNIKNIEIQELGLFKENCKKVINIFDSTTHSSLFDISGVDYKASEQQEISLVTGNSFTKENNIETIDFLKLDLEGAEYDAILGFEKLIDNGKIKAIQFEYGYINISTKILLNDYYNYFESKGYILGKIFPKTVEFRTYNFKHEDFIGPNFIAVKKDETELITLLSNK